MPWCLGLGVLEIFCLFGSWVCVGLGFLLRFFNYTLQEPNCQEVCWFTKHLAYCYKRFLDFAR